MPAPVRPPRRDGVEPTRVRLPAGPWATVAEYLRSRFPAQAPSLAERLAAGEVLTAAGEPVDLTTPFRGGDTVFVYRPLPAEPEVPGGLPVLYRDENLLVVDKPHFLATMPRGSHVARTALVQVRRLLSGEGRIDLDPAPAHRLDRLTAGVLLFTLRPQVRGAYQELFARGEAVKTYLAVTAAPAGPVPPRVENRLEKVRGVLQAHAVPGPVNAITDLAPMATGSGRTLWRLRPHTGRTHQLRVHLSDLGLPILGDPLYPEVRTIAPDDFCDPLQLLAAELAFTDPLTGTHRVFRSERHLAAAPPRL